MVETFASSVFFDDFFYIFFPFPFSPPFPSFLFEGESGVSPVEQGYRAVMPRE